MHDLRVLVVVMSVVSAVGSPALAQEAPTAAPAVAPAAAPSPDEIKRVLEYQENGAATGPVLLDVVACAKVDTTKGSPTAFTCLEPISGSVKKNSVVQVWTQWFCPKGGKYEDLSIQALADGEVRTTTDIKVEGLSRTRTWRQFTASKAGKWEFKVRQAGKDLGSVKVTVEN